MYSVKRFSKLAEDMTQSELNEHRKTKGVILKGKNGWRIIGKPGNGLWKSVYDTKEEAEDGLKAYFANKK